MKPAGVHLDQRQRAEGLKIGVERPNCREVAEQYAALSKEAEVSSKVLPKTNPKEKVGNFVLVDGRLSMIEYSDLPDDWASETDDLGRLKFWAANPAIHLFDVGFLHKIAAEAERLPWHLARMKVSAHT